MARPNRVFFLCSGHNGLRRNYTSPLQFLDTMVEALVSGSGPYPVVSINIVDNVATVNLGEAVTIIPGTKVDIQGTGVPEVDGLQEVSSISENTFTFKVESANASFTNGLTFGYPSLGWSLLYRSANRLVLKTGTSQGRSDCILVRTEWQNSQGATFVFYKVKNPRSVNDFEEISPVYNGPNRRLCIFVHTIENATPESKQYEYYFYGDDSFALFGFNRIVTAPGTEQNDYRFQFTSAAFGYLANAPSDTGGFLIAGCYHWTMYTDHNFYMSTFLWGHHSVFNNEDSFVNVFSEYGKDKDSSSIPAGLRAAGYLENVSGNLDSASSQRVDRQNNYFDAFVLGTDKRNYGTFPGLRWMFSAPPLVRFGPNIGIAFKTKVTGELEGRNVACMYSGPLNIPLEYKSGINRNRCGIHLLDLTGPIR